MSTLLKVDKLNILKQVMSKVGIAKAEILSTMNLFEELKTPLPLEYFFLLNKKMQEGVVIKRLAFGTKSEFQKFNKRHSVKYKNYICILSKSKDYRRMILIDRKYLFFVDIKNSSNFFFTTDQSRINNFLAYFQHQFKNRFC